MSTESFSYETRQALQGQLSDGELASLRDLARLLAAVVAAIYAGLAAVMAGRRASRSA